MIYFQQEIDTFTSTNAQNLYALWDVATTYAVGDIRRVGTYTYKSTAAGNIGNDPLTTLGIFWVKWDPANDYAMLDLLEDTTTIWTGDGVVEFLRGSKDTIGIGNFQATSVVVDYLDTNGTTLLDTDTYSFSNNGNVYDAWTYGYGGFTEDVSAVVYAPIRKVGETIRVTFSRGGSSTYCGYMVAGVAVDMGNTLENITFPDKRIGTRTVSVANFTTYVPRNELMRKIAEAKVLVNEVMLFVIDPAEDSLYNNMVVLGKIIKVEGVANNVSVNNITWQVEQNILE